MPILNLGILAHVDAGKTSLTERLLFTTGIIHTIGSVDRGNTQTDTLALERQRGITIKAAVVSFAIDDLTINLIDTPGHPDFIAEVERVLSVLDGAVLVISAVEGVQAQTRVLMRVLQRLRIPTLLFINKIDRRGAQHETLLQRIAEKLSPAIIPMGTPSNLGDRDAEFLPYAADSALFRSSLLDHLAEHNDALLQAYLTNEAAISYQQLYQELAVQTGKALVYPVFFGSAITGAGISALIAALKDLLPVANPDSAGPASGSVFKIERGPAGEKIAYVRMFSGSLRVRDQVHFAADKEARVTAITVFDHGADRRCDVLLAGQIGKLWGLGAIQIGDSLGTAAAPGERHFFAPPTLETLIVPQRISERRALYTALTQLTEQDPLINLRTDELRQELFVSLYGEVQKEVIQATLAQDYHIDVTFSETSTICIERPVAMGSAVEYMGKAPNPFIATVGLRVEPAPLNSGVFFQRANDILGTLPLAFFKAVEEAVYATLRQGLYGWELYDCRVTMTHTGYDSVTSTAGDFRNLTPLVLMEALKQADTLVYEPVQHFYLEFPIDMLGRMQHVLAQLHAIAETPIMRDTVCVLEGSIPAAQVHELQQQLPGLTRGEGVLECVFDHYAPIRGPIPSRQRWDHNPLNRKEYLLHVVRRV